MEKSLLAFQHWRSASEKFDYFVMGATGALCAFIAQSYVPKRISFSPNTGELIALLLLIASVMAGFKRAKSSILEFKWMHKRWYASEEGGRVIATLSTGQTAPELGKQLQEIVTRFQECEEKAILSAERYAMIRNWLLAAGFLLLLAAKVWGAYV